MQNVFILSNPQIKVTLPRAFARTQIIRKEKAMKLLVMHYKYAAMKFIVGHEHYIIDYFR